MDSQIKGFKIPHGVAEIPFHVRPCFFYRIIVGCIRRQKEQLRFSSGKLAQPPFPVERRLVHDHRMPSRYFLKQAADKPPFKKLALGPLTIAFNGVMRSGTQGSHDVDPFKSIPSGKILDRLPSRRPGVFPL